MQRLFVSTCTALLMVAIGCTQRPSETTLTDAELQRMVKTRLQADASVSRLDLGVQADAEHNAVALTGTAYTQKQRTRAVEAAKAVREGLAVEDKIDVKPYEIPKELFDDEMMADAKAEAAQMGDKMGSTIEDAWLHTKVVAKLVADSDTPQRRINVDVTDAIVTLRGDVPTREAREEAERIAREVDGVKAVTNRLQIRKS